MRTIFITPPDEKKRRKGRRRWMAGGIGVLLPQSAMMGGGGLRWLNEVASPGPASQMADKLFRTMLTGVTGIGLPVIAIACGVHFIKLGGNKAIGAAMIVAGPVVSVLSVMAGYIL